MFADWSFDWLSTLHSVEKISFGLLEKKLFSDQSGAKHMTEILDSIQPILEKVTGQLLFYFNGADGALQALAAAGFIVIILLFFLARRQSFSAKSSEIVSEPVILNDLYNKAETVNDDHSDVLASVASERNHERNDGAANTVTNADGFVFHRRKAKNKKSSAKIDDADPEIALAAIEQEMLATRQLFLDGVISREVYVAQTRELYSKAQQKI